MQHLRSGRSAIVAPGGGYGPDGPLAAPLVADRGLAAVWFTPLLTDEPTVAALRRAMGPVLLVGGTADQFWDSQAARSLASLALRSGPCAVNDRYRE